MVIVVRCPSINFSGSWWDHGWQWPLERGCGWMQVVIKVRFTVIIIIAACSYFTEMLFD